MSSLNGDLMSEILGRVDGITLANAACVSSEFLSIARQENMWEEACSNLWPSTVNTDVKQLINSSLGGFRNFYANCFPCIAYETSEKDFNCSEMKKICDDSLELHSCDPSDFVSLVDVWYMDKIVYSKILWGIPNASNVEDWFCNRPFRVDFIDFWDLENEDSTNGDGFPTVVSFDKEMGEDIISGQLMDKFKLSWIVINRRTGEAANLSSWRPLIGQMYSDADFLMRFGSLLPAQNILPFKDVQCILAISIRLSDDNGDMKISELSMQFEDMMGGRVNGRNSLAILERALSCRKSKEHQRIFQSYQKYLSQQRKMKEAMLRNEGVLDTLCILSGIVSFVSFCCLIYRMICAI
ncbi:hypothetical protein SUGI_1184740 [Cryptomeria japonica]|uniref:F-box protein At2g27310-like n=1 Tax=Cryptomeria japonica TaxID=3369 RepID=UPI0024147049|nr:F-box protein At2g27310-like [Cryptomeria japonica]GLJ55214.1 hypothetical protein SUGI_1184740 [Cryptomeria japonica]